MTTDPKDRDVRALAEPEVVWHMLCPNAEVDELGGINSPAMELARRLDDEAGHQRVYVCPKCNAEISVNYAPGLTADPKGRDVRALVPELMQAIPTLRLRIKFTSGHDLPIECGLLTALLDALDAADTRATELQAKYDLLLAGTNCTDADLKLMIESLCERMTVAIADEARARIEAAYTRATEAEQRYADSERRVLRERHMANNVFSAKDEAWGIEHAARIRAEQQLAEARAEVAVLRGVGCREAKLDEPESGPCGVCLKCLREALATRDAALADAKAALEYIAEGEHLDEAQDVALSALAAILTPPPPDAGGPA